MEEKEKTEIFLFLTSVDLASLCFWGPGSRLWVQVATDTSRQGAGATQAPEPQTAAWLGSNKADRQKATK